MGNIFSLFYPFFFLKFWNGHLQDLPRKFGKRGNAPSVPSPWISPYCSNCTWRYREVHTWIYTCPPSYFNKSFILQFIQQETAYWGSNKSCPSINRNFLYKNGKLISPTYIRKYASLNIVTESESMKHSVADPGPTFEKTRILPKTQIRIILHSFDMEMNRVDFSILYHHVGQ